MKIFIRAVEYFALFVMIILCVQILRDRICIVATIMDGINTVTFCATLVTAVVAISGCVQKIYEDKTKLLLSYNERFVQDETIQKVIKFLQKYEGKELTSECLCTEDAPQPHEFQLFARFFEELNVVIQENGLNKKNACRLFAYYAIEVYDKNKQVAIVDDDLDVESWYLFSTFIRDMKKTEKKLGITH